MLPKSPWGGSTPIPPRRARGGSGQRRRDGTARSRRSWARTAPSIASSSRMQGGEGHRPSTPGATAEPSKAQAVAAAEDPVETSSAPPPPSAGRQRKGRPSLQRPVDRGGSGCPGNGWEAGRGRSSQQHTGRGGGRSGTLLKARHSVPRPPHPPSNCVERTAAAQQPSSLTNGVRNEREQGHHGRAELCRCHSDRLLRAATPTGSSGQPRPRKHIRQAPPLLRRAPPRVIC